MEKVGNVAVWVGLEILDESSGEVDVLKELCGIKEYNEDDYECNHFDFKISNLRELLKDFSFVDSFLEDVIDEADSKGIANARWVVALYDQYYDPAKVKGYVAKNPVFIGNFSYDED